MTSKATTEPNPQYRERVYQSSWEHCTRCGRKAAECNGTTKPVCNACRGFKDTRPPEYDR